MDLEDLIDRYRSYPDKIRLLAIGLLATVPGLFHWFEEGDLLHEQLIEVQGQEQAEKARLESAKRKVSELPQILKKINQTEISLEKARRFLPDRVPMNEVLAKLGSFEDDLDIQLVKFIPGQENQPNPQMEYREIPVDLTVRATFPRIMRFYDRILHMENLTHLRKITFSRVGNEAEVNADQSVEKVNAEVQSEAQLILFKGDG